MTGGRPPNGGLAIDTWHMGKLRIAPEELKRIPGDHLAWVELSDGPVRVHGRPDRRGDQPPPAAGRGRVRHPGLHRGVPGDRLRRSVGSRGPVRGAAHSPDRRGVQARLRDDRRAVRRRRDEPSYERRPDAGAGQRQAGLDVHPDAADPGVRGAGQADLRGAPRRDPRPHASRRRRRGVDRRVAGDAAARRPADGDLPLPRLPDRARHRHQGDHGRDLRPQGRAVRRLRRLDAPGRPRRAASSARRASSARASPRPPASRSPRRSESRARSSCRSSATAPPSRARSTSRSTSPRCGSCRSST